MKITKTAVDKLPIPPTAQAGKTAQKRYYDDTIKGFGVRVASGGTRAFFIEKLIKKKLCRITLGRYPELTVEMAKKEAQKLLGQIAMGLDPVAQKQTAKMREVSLNDVFNDYLQVRKSLKPSTLTNYKQILTKAFPNWLNKPLISITKDKIAKQHQQLGAAHGEAYANLAMRVLRALFNFAAGQYEDAEGKSLVPENPVRRLSQTRAWYRIERRQTLVKSTELAPWYEALKCIQNKTLHDYLILILFTGLRRQEAATLKWEQVDLNEKTLIILDTKNRDQHTLPLSDFLYELLQLRKNKKTNDYVFAGTGATGHIIEPRKQMAKVTELTGIQFTVHDLRRTFITIAESLDIPAYALKRLLNHRMANDVTAGYIIADIERLRKPMQLITDYILKCMGLRHSTEVTNFQTLNHENTITV